MKQLSKHFLLLFAVLAMGACSSDGGDIPSSVEEPETVLVSLNMGGEISVEHENMTRAATNDVYGINVYYDKESDGVVDDLYGYGVFSDPDKMIIALLASHKYIFKCTMVKNGKNTLYYDAAKVAYPFQTNSSVTSTITNEFTLGTSTYLSGIGSGKVHLSSQTSPSSSNATSYASVNRFYGESDTYTPTVGGSVTIALKRVVFGAKFIINGVEGGTVTASCGGFWNHSTTTDYEGAETIYSFTDSHDAWLNETPLDATLSLKFDSDKGDGWDLTNSETISFKRNVMTTVTINVSPDLSSASLSITEEEFGEDNNIYIGIDGDTIVETEVNPEEEE